MMSELKPNPKGRQHNRATFKARELIGTEEMSRAIREDEEPPTYDITTQETEANNSICEYVLTNSGAENWVRKVWH